MTFLLYETHSFIHLFILSDQYRTPPNAHKAEDVRLTSIFTSVISNLNHGAYEITELKHCFLQYWTFYIWIMFDMSLIEKLKVGGTFMSPYILPSVWISTQ